MLAEPILITGASSDIGRAVMRHLLDRANPPLILAHFHRSSEKLHALHEEFGERVQLVNADFSEPDSVRAMAESITSNYGTPAALLHLPALQLHYERFKKFDWANFQRDMAVQVQSVVILLQHFLPKMVKLPRARVIFVLSSAVHGTAPKYMSMYTTVKYAQLGLMRSLAAEYASSSVRINAISPSMVETQFLEKVGEVAIQMSAAANPQGRNATPEDLVGTIELLLSASSDYIHGVDIPIAAGSVC